MQEILLWKFKQVRMNNYRVRKEQNFFISLQVDSWRNNSQPQVVHKLLFFCEMISTHFLRELKFIENSLSLFLFVFPWLKLLKIMILFTFYPYFFLFLNEIFCWQSTSYNMLGPFARHLSSWFVIHSCRLTILSN